MNRETLVLGDPLLIRPYRFTDQLRARLFGAALDQRLADGQAPESSGLLAARARHIVSLPRRQVMARDWEHLLWLARRNQGPARGTRAGQITAAGPAIRELARCLRAPLPVSARGVAAANVLLTDGTGPVYSRYARVPLTAALESAITHLDPAIPLMPSD